MFWRKKKTEEQDAPTPAEQASEIGGDANPYDVGRVERGLQEALDQVDHVGSPFEHPLERPDDERK